MDEKGIPRIHRALALAGLALAILALGVDLAGGCARCGRRDWTQAAVAALGIAGYGALVLAGCRRRRALFFAGVFVAAGIHAALVAWMFTEGRLCPVCIAAALAAIFNMTLAVVRKTARPHLVERAFIPAILAASVAALAALVAEGAQDRERMGAPKRTAVSERPVDRPARPAALSVTVYENEHCSYCEEFRREYLPRLVEDFGDRLDVVFLTAANASWISRTPTIVVAGGAVYEGLPEYPDLAAAIAEGLASSSPKP